MRSQGKYTPLSVSLRTHKYWKQHDIYRNISIYIAAELLYCELKSTFWHFTIQFHEFQEPQWYKCWSHKFWVFSARKWQVQSHIYRVPPKRRLFSRRFSPVLSTSVYIQTGILKVLPYVRSGANIDRSPENQPKGIYRPDRDHMFNN